MVRVAAGVLAATLGVVGVAQPATAAPAQAPAAKANAAMAFDWVGAVIAVAGALYGGGGGSNLDAAVQQIIAAIEESEANILNHIDAIASAEVRACARAHAIEFSDINNMSTSVRQLWAQAATQCAALATAYLDAVVSKNAVDNLGHVIGEIYAIAIAARVKANLLNGVDLLLRDQVRSYEVVVAKLAPSCSEQRYVEYDTYGRVVTVEIHYTCVAYNGDQATDYELYYLGRLMGRPLDRNAVANSATRNTSRAVALEALPRLRSALP
ncbi:hypothetical protein Psuf_054870 [Phytohabitans suffuscus]|uniref:Uncharacterized protein n=1 Tax=Phytohabitans suffuscus TaxID=624315 RepID=A0A6F8YQ22_9ACTN|nr:hypothetical protein Psuf_054870 [Phytohabitans suffuscus]